jgi:hypothetical protein
MSSTAASITQQEEPVRNSTWEVKFKVLREFQAMNNHVKVIQGNSNQHIYSRVRNERQLYKKDPQSCDSLLPVLQKAGRTGISIEY